MAARQEVTFIISARDQTRAVFRRVGRSVKRFVANAAAAGALAGGLFAAAARSALNFSTNLDALSQRLNVSVETLQALEFIGSKTGVSLEQIAMVIQRLGTNAGAALDNNEKMAEAFERLGLTVGTIRQLSRTELFLGLAAGVENFNGTAEELQNTLRTIIDTEGIRLVPLLRAGAEGLSDQIVALKERNLLLSSPEVKRAAEDEAAIRLELLQLQRELNREMLPLISALTELLARGDAESLAPGGLLRTGAAVARGSVERLGEFGERASAGLFDLQQEAAQRGLSISLSKIATNTEETAQGIRDVGIIQ